MSRMRFTTRSMLAAVAVCAVVAWGVRTYLMNRPINRLIRSLKYGDSKYQSIDAQRKLAKLGKPAVDALLAEVRRDDPRSRILAANTLARMGPVAQPAIPIVIDSLIDTMDDGDALVHIWAVRSLTEIGEDAVSALSNSLRDSRPAVRRGSAVALGEIGPSAIGAVPDLHFAVRDKDPAVRVSAARALWQITGDPDLSVSTILDVLGELQLSDSVIVACAAFAGEVGARAESVVPQLCNIFQRAVRAETRAALVAALGRIGANSDATVDVLIEALHDDRTSFVSCRAIEKLSALPSEKRQRVIAEVEKLLSHKDKRIRRAAIESIGGHIETFQIVPSSVVDSLVDNDPAVRSAAALTIGRMKERAASVVPELTNLLDDDNSRVQISAAIALFKIGRNTERSIRVLTDGAKSTNLILACTSIDALGEIGPFASSAIPTLENLYRGGSHADVRRHASDALTKIKTLGDQKRLPCGN